MKQVIVMRKDLKMRRGKEIAQGCHASMAFLTRQLKEATKLTELDNTGGYTVWLKSYEKEWIDCSFAKICVQVDSETQLDEIAIKAKEVGIKCHVVTDSGLTEFNGVPTKTCLALGPDESEKLDKITWTLEIVLMDGSTNEVACS